MGYLYFHVDEAAIKAKLKNELATKSEVQEKATSIVSNLFNRAHTSLMREFEDHPITQEIKAGNTAQNTSETLGGDGNLFTFLGFYVGQEPTEELQQTLAAISFRKSSTRDGVINFNIINLPNHDTIRDATRMNWGDASWAFGVEDGDFRGGADLAHFIFKNWEGARSQAGFQVKGYEYSEEEFSPRPYITEILDNFASRVNNSRSKFLV